MTIAFPRRQRNRHVSIHSLRRVILGLRRVILGMFQDYAELFQVANESPEDFPWRAAAISAHWTPIIMRILASDLPEIEDLEGLNNLVTFLDLDVEEFLLAFPEQVEAVFIACANYAPFEPYWVEMEPVLLECLDRIQVEENEEENEEEEDEQPMIIG